MGLLDKFKKKPNDVIRQDLSRITEPGEPFIMHLFMKEKCEMPDKGLMLDIMQKHLGEIDCFCHDDEAAGFASKRYQAEFKEGSIPPQLMVMGCIETDGYNIDEITKSQMWDCPESEKILAECRYQVVATDVLGGAMTYKDRAEMLMDYMEALVELYPTCVAVQFQTSGKMFTKDEIINHQIPREHRFIYFAVNVRFFNIQGTDDMLVDSFGMSTLYLPDLQYHFHGMEPDYVVNHAYNVLTYIYDQDCQIESGETIDGIVDGEISGKLQWKCQYEDSLIQPSRPVLDICMGEYASGNRE